MPKAPRTSLFKSSLVLCFFLWSSCSTICGITIFPLSPPFGTKAPCDLCHVIGAYSAAFTTAKSGTKKCFHDRRGTVWTSFAFAFVSNPVCAVVVFHRFERQGCSGILPDLRLKTIPVSLQNEVQLFLHTFHFIAESDSHGLFKGFLLSPQSSVVLQVSWQSFFSLIPSSVQPVALTDDELVVSLPSSVLR